MNVLIMRRASLSPWQGKDVWWFLQSGCRRSRSRSSKPTNRTLHRKRKRSEDRLTKELTKWDWCDRVINFYKNLTSLLKWQLAMWMDTPTLTKPNPPHNRRMRSMFMTNTKAQSYPDNAFRITLYIVHYHWAFTHSASSHKKSLHKKSCDSFYNVLNITTHTHGFGIITGIFSFTKYI